VLLVIRFAPTKDMIAKNKKVRTSQLRSYRVGLSKWLKKITIVEKLNNAFPTAFGKGRQG